MYNLCLFLLGFFYLPKMRKYWRLWPKKMGGDFEGIQKGAVPLVWIHAVSMGETKAIIYFAKLLHQKYPHIEFLITSITETGLEEAKRSLPFAKYHCFLPLDFSWIINPIVKRLKPDLVILSETDYWYNFLHAAKNSGASIAVINGKLSTRSQKRYKLLGPLLRSFFSPIDVFCVQTEEYKERLEKLNISQEKIFVTGNLKFDAPQETLKEEELQVLKNKFQIGHEDFVIVAGSTHETEEALILDTYKKLLPTYPQLKILFVPRHPERFQRVEKLFQDVCVPYVKWSTLYEYKGDKRLFLIDTMGFLKKCYQLADLAIMGGSFVSHVGGHNVLEPAFYGVPVIFGPHMYTQKEFTDLILGAGAGEQISNEQLTFSIENLIRDKEKHAAYSKQGKALTSDLKGTSERTLKVLEEKFQLSTNFACNKFDHELH